MVLRIANAARRSALAACGVVLVVGSTSLLGACSWLHIGESDEDAYDYHKVKTSKGPLEVPPDLTPVSKDDRPAATSATASAVAAATAVARPDPAAVAATVAVAGEMVAPAVPGVRLVHEGGQHWLALDGSPELAYATVKDLLTGLGYTIATDEPRLGVLETTWAERHPVVNEDALRNSLHRVFGAFDSNGERYKYRARIERTPRNTAEITVTVRAMEEVFTTPMRDTTVWQAAPVNPDLEAEMLQRIALRFQPVQPMQVAVAPVAGSTPPVAAASPIPAPIPAAGAPAPAAEAAPAHVHKVTTDGFPSLQVEDTLERTWRAVGVALDRGGFTIEDRSRDKHRFVVRYLDPEYEAREREKMSWWTRVFNSDAKVPEQQFQILVSANGPTTVVEVRDRDGRQDNEPTARRILDQLMEQLR